MPKEREGAPEIGSGSAQVYGGGVVVSLSNKNDRSSHRERRQHSEEIEFNLAEVREKKSVSVVG